MTIPVLPIGAKVLSPVRETDEARSTGPQAWRTRWLTRWLQPSVRSSAVLA